jgi:CRP-like cAMP-binding protein
MRTIGTHNRLLAALPPEVFDSILADSTRVPLTAAAMLHEQDEPVQDVILPESGVVSLVTVMEDGMAVEAAVIGQEGVVGFPLTADGLSPWRAVVQVEGEGLRIPVHSFKQHLERAPALRSLVEAFVATLLAFAAQSTACSRFHELPARMARWMLITHDRAGSDEFRMTHEFLGQMLGAHRPSVTLAARVLQDAGLIEYGRGRVRVLDREGLEQASCECYRRIRRRHEALVPD